MIYIPSFRATDARGEGREHIGRHSCSSTPKVGILGRIALSICGALLFAFSFPVAYGFLVGDVVLAVLLFFVIIGRRRSAVYRAELVLYSLVGVFVIAMLGSANMFDAAFEKLYQPLRYLITIIGIVFVFCGLSMKELNVLILSMFASAMVAAIVGVIVYLLAYGWAVSAGWVTAQRLALWFQPNQLATIFANGFALSAFIYLSGIWKSLILVAVSVVVFFLAISFTMSLGGMLVYIFALCIFFLAIIYGRGRIKGVPIFVGAILGVVAIAFVLSAGGGYHLPERFERRIVPYYEMISFGLSKQEGRGEALDTGSAASRLERVTSSLDLIAENPLLGAGSGGYEQHGANPHSFPVVVALEGGLVAASAILGLLGWIAYTIRRRLKNTPALWGAAIVFMACSASFLRHGHVYQSVYWVPLLIVFALSIVVARHRMDSTKRTAAWN